ncbi:MAG: acyl carrier protein [Gammaproteobacteria bacterium]|nr:MAG: acyl carrier protein [Gammaproteobacteria bacterium]
MESMDKEVLMQELKALIVEECDTELGANDIESTELLLGGGSRLGLDSLDGLQISLAVKERYGKRIEGGNKSRLALTSIETLADFILS